jgi:hypothetical protein
MLWRRGPWSRQPGSSVRSNRGATEADVGAALIRFVAQRTQLPSGVGVVPERHSLHCPVLSRNVVPPVLLLGHGM